MITLIVAKQGEMITFFQAADSTAPRGELEVQPAPGADGPPRDGHTKQGVYFLFRRRKGQSGKKGAAARPVA